MKIILIQPHRRTGRFTITAITFLVLLVWPQARLQSAIVTWDAVTGTTGAQDGSGTWNTVTANWWNGSTDVLWPNSTNDTAVVGAASGSAGTINISGTITLSNLTFNAAGSGNYTLAGGTLSFSGPAQPTIIVNTDATISSSILGTNLNKSGAGDLTLNGNNAALAGNLIVSSGVLNIASSTALGSISAVDTSGVNGASTVFSGDISIPSGTLMNRAHVSAYAYTNLSGNNTWGGGMTINTSGSGSLYGITSTAGKLTLTGGVTDGAAGTRTLTLDCSSGDIEIDGVMASGANTMPVIKTGTGTLTLTGANSFSGGLTVNAGTLFARTSGSVLGGSGAGVVKLGDTSGSANVTLLVGSSLNLTNPITVLSGSSGTVTINNYANYSPIFAGAITLNKNLTVYNGNASGVRAITIGGNISGGGGLQITAANIADPIILSGSNSFSGGVMLYSGNLIINSTNAFGATASILSIWGGELDNTNAAVITIANNNPQNWNADFTFVGTQNLNLGNGNVTLGGNRQVTVVSNTLTVGGAISGLGYALTKTGAGTLSLTGANTFSGNTTISSGTLALGATGSIISTPLITIGSGATFDVSAPGAFQLNGSTTLAGNGTVNGSVTEQAGGVIFPGGSGQAGTLTLNNNLTLNQGGNLYYNLTNSTGGPNSTLTVGGSINCSGTNVSTFYPIAGDFASGTYVLMNYGNTLIGGATNFAISLANTQSRRTFLFNTSTYGEVKLVVGGSPLANLVWTGDGVANAWNYNSAANWTNGSSRDVFKQLDAVVFDDTGSASPVVSLVGALYPQSITFSNQSKSYTFGGSGSLNGVGGLSLQSGGTVTLANTGGNTFSGAIIINSGELILADPNAIGQASSARLVAGTGILGLSGGYVFSSIPLQLVGSASAGDNLVNISGTNVWTGSCTLNSGGANYGIRSDDGQLILTGNIAPISSLTGTRTLALGGGGNGIISGVIANGIACTTALNLAGTGEWILSGTNTYTGSTSINSGILAVNGVLQGGTVFLYGGILGGTGVINGPVTPIFGGTLAPAAYSNKTSKLTVNNTLTTPPTTVMQIARTGTVVTNDSVVGISALTYGGTLNIITNASSGILHVGDTFKLFSASNYIGTFNTINYPDGYTFTNRLAVDGTLTVLTAPVTIPTASTNIMYFISGNSLHLSWPASYLGWSLQVQTNSLGTGLSTNWMTISGAELVTSTNIPISAKNGSVFYRMKYMP